MRAAAAFLVGTHDFAAFSANPHRETAGTVRTIFSISVTRRGPLVTISVTGNSTFDYDGTGQLNGGTVIVNGQQVTTLPNQMMGGRGGMGGGNGGFGGGWGGKGGRGGW